MKTTAIRIKDISFADYNPRTISKEDFTNLKQSIKEFGFAENVVLNDRKQPGFPNAQLTLVSGHMRVRAAGELGIEDVPAVVLSLDPAREKALNLAMNRIAGEWDDQALAEILYDLDDEMRGFTGFHADELEKILGTVADVAAKEPHAKELTCPQCGHTF